MISMGNKVSQKSSYNLREMDELSQFISNINMLDGFFMDTTLSISSKCLVIINNLINDENVSEIQHDDLMLRKIEKLKFHCGLIRHLAVVNSSANKVSELIELNNVHPLTSLTLDHVSIKYVQHLKQHRPTLLKLCVYHSIDNLESLINLCGGDHSFPQDWTKLIHLDVRYNHLRNIGDSVSLLPALTVLDVSRNDIEDFSFIQNIPNLTCLNASFNHIRALPIVYNTTVRILILGYNYLDGLEGIKGFKGLTTLNVSYNMIANNDYLQQIKEMDYLKDVILKGNPLSYAPNYRQKVLDVVSPRVGINFAVDGIPLTKRENIYLRKRPMFQIAPPHTPTIEIYKEVPIIVATKSEQLACYSGTSDSQSCANSLSRRNINRPPIANLSELYSNTNGVEAVQPSLRSIARRNEKEINSLFVSEVEPESHGDGDVTSPRIESVTYADDPQTIRVPYYVGEKTSIFTIGWKSSFQVSVQIIEHRLMIVDEGDTIIDNLDLWKLMATTTDAVLQTASASKVLNMVFFLSYNSDNDEGLCLCRRKIEFAKEQELELFSDQLSIYLQGFTISLVNWTNPPLINTSLNCKNCFSKFKPKGEQPRPYCCNSCSSTDFVITSIEKKPVSRLSPRQSPVNSPRTSPRPSPLVDRKLGPQVVVTPVTKKPYHKSSTSSLVIRTFGSTDSLLKRKDDTLSVNSDVTSYHTAVNLTNPEMSQGEISEPFLDVESGRSTPDNELDNEGETDESQITFNLDKPLDPSILSLCMSSTPKKEYDELDRSTRSKLNFDRPVDLTNLSLSNEIVPHKYYGDDTRTLIHSQLKEPWVIHESRCDVKIHMHNSIKIDDRLKLYFLTKVMEDQENLVAVFKVYFAYRSTGLTSAALLVISDSRLMIFSFLDKISTNMDECVKLSGEFSLKSLLQLEYCLNNQWLELQFKNKTTVSVFVGDGESVKRIGVAITEVVSQKMMNVSMVFSKGIDKLKCPAVLSTMTSDLYDGTTMETLALSESYLLRSCSMVPVVEKSTLDYAPKILVIDATHLFIITINYSGKGQQAFELSRTIDPFTVKHTIIIDSSDDCRIHLSIFEQGTNHTVALCFMSPVARAKAVLCLDRLLNDLYRVDVIMTLADLSAKEGL